MATNSSPVIDFGSHWQPPGSRPEENPGSDEYTDIERDAGAYGEWFNEGGVDGAVLSQPSWMGHEDAEKVAAANDDLFETVDEYDMYYGLAALPIAAGGEAAAAEFERVLDMGFNGGAIPTDAYGIEITDEEIEPVLEIADQTGAPLFVHQAPGGPDRELLGDDFMLNHSFGRETATCKSVVKVIHLGVLDRYPNLNLVYHHYAGNLPSMLGRVNLHLQASRWPDRYDERAMKPWAEFKDQLEERIYVDTSGHFAAPGPLRTALEHLPASQILLGTDSPSEPKTPDELRENVQIVQQVTSRKEARKILGENALELMVNV